MIDIHSAKMDSTAEGEFINLDLKIAFVSWYFFSIIEMMAVIPVQPI